MAKGIAKKKNQWGSRPLSVPVGVKPDRRFQPELRFAGHARAAVLTWFLEICRLG
jgi:hypothetical protein